MVNYVSQNTQDCDCNYRSNQDGIFKMECIMENSMFTVAMITFESHTHNHACTLPWESCQWHEWCVLFKDTLTCSHVDFFLRHASVVTLQMGISVHRSRLYPTYIENAYFHLVPDKCSSYYDNVLTPHFREKTSPSMQPPWFVLQKRTWLKTSLGAGPPMDCSH